ncbi:MAG: DUF1570 domain-containing protein [Planctomycetes bacterium]|nr:DUF1570 domain-containing protein [Planctomycetota bacterium]
MTRRALLALLLALLTCAAPAPARGDEALAERAEEALDAKRFGEALALARQALVAAPDSAAAQYAMGRALLRFSRLDQARRHLERARALDPELMDEACDANLALVAFFYPDDDRVRELIEDLPADSWVRRQLGRLLSLEGFVVRRSERYLVHAHHEVARRGGDARGAQLLEGIYKAYAKVFPFEVDRGRINRVYLLPDARTYRDFIESVWGPGVAGQSVGQYHVDQGALVINCGTYERDAEQGFSRAGVRTLFHEAFHQFIYTHAPEVPSWLDEGLADYFSTTELHGASGFKVGSVHPGRLARLRDALAGRGERPLSLREFTRLDDERFKGDEQLLNYAQGWGLVHFLLHAPSMGRKGHALVRDYFLALREGRTPEEAHAATFGAVDLDRLEAAWVDHIRRLP